LTNTPTERPIRFGLLGAARITRKALIDPARKVHGGQVCAIAARDPARARAYAARHAIPTVHANYADLIADPEIDAVYNPLPNSLHAEWSIRALEAGKHVLCEKPLAANAAEAEAMAATARSNDRLLVEAFHYRYHPLMARVLAILDSGELGNIRHLSAQFCSPMLRRKDIRLRDDLAGGALMDMGCYTIHLLRTLARLEPEVLDAHALLHSPQIDRAMTADFRFPNGATGHIHCSLRSSHLLGLTAKVQGDLGALTIVNPFLPHLFHWLAVRTAEGKRRERVRGETTYTHQLRAFVAAIHTGEALPTGPADAIANLRVIDAVYRAAGLSPRSHGL
jgi:predicted dehydrogenase